MKRFMKDFRYSPYSLFITVPVVLLIGKFLFYLFNHKHFNWGDEAIVLLGFTFVVSIVLVAIIAFTYKNADYSPLSIQESIINIASTEFINHTIFNSSRGVFILAGAKVEDGSLINTYIPVSHPELWIGKIRAYESILVNIKNSHSEKVRKTLKTLNEEFQYALDNPEKIKSKVLTKS